MIEHPELFIDAEHLPAFPLETIDGVLCEVARATSPGPVRGNIIGLHGIFSNSEEFRPYFRALAANGFNVFGVNFPGHGPEYHPRKVRNLRAHHCVDAARRVVEAVGGGVVFGKSFGGLIAQAVAHHPAVKATLLFASSPPPGVSFKPSPRLALGALPVIAQTLLFKTFRYSYDFCRRYIYNKAKDEAQARRWYDLMHPVESSYLVLDQALGKIAVRPLEPHGPVVVMVGSEDPGLPPVMQQKTAKMWGAEYWELPGFGHMFTEEPGWAEVCKRVTRWVIERFPNEGDATHRESAGRPGTWVSVAASKLPGGERSRGPEPRPEHPHNQPAPTLEMHRPRHE